LNREIAKALLKKPALLIGKEIRFLRKRMRLSSKSYASLLRIEKTTLSKWENDRQGHTPQNDLLIRTFHLVDQAIPLSDSRNIMDHLSQIRLKPPLLSYVILVERIGDRYSASIKPIGGAFTAMSTIRCIADGEIPSTTATPRQALFDIASDNDLLAHPAPIDLTGTTALHLTAKRE